METDKSLSIRMLFEQFVRNLSMALGSFLSSLFSLNIPLFFISPLNYIPSLTFHFPLTFPFPLNSELTLFSEQSRKKFLGEKINKRQRFESTE